MKEIKKNRATAIALSAVLAAGLIGGALALGGCGSTKVKTSYTPKQGDGNTYYVSADVSQFTAEDCDGSFENPYNILDLVGYGSSGNHSYDSILEPGDTVLVMPGQYKQITSVYVEKSGTYDNYITIMNAAYADDGHTYESTSAVISLYGESFDGNNRGVTINSDYIYWYGIDVAGAGDNGMYIGGNHNVIENCQFYNNRDTGLQLGRKQSADVDIKDWPSYNLIKNCTAFNNYDNETYGENADGFGAKLTIGYGNMFDGCIAYRNSDDGWDLYAKEDTGNIGCVIIYNCIAFENGYIMETQETCNARFGTFSDTYAELNTNSYTTRDGDGNGFKLGGGSNEGDVKLYNCMSFNNRMHGVTDNSNPGTLQIENVTSYNNCASIDNDSTSSTFGQVKYSGGTEDSGCANIDLSRWSYSYNTLANVLSVIDGNSKTAGDAYRGAATNSMFVSSSSIGYYIEESADADTKNDGGVRGESYKPASASKIFEETPAFTLGTTTKFDGDGVALTEEGNVHFDLREEDGTINAGDILKIKKGADLVLEGVGANLSETSWNKYTHYEYTCGQSSKSETADEIAAVSNMIYLPVYEGAVYQNFKVVNSIWGVDISWSSSSDKVLRVTNNVKSTTSNSSTVDVEINRDAKKDKTVKLTASFEVNGKSAKKTFKLKVKKDTPSIGDVLVDGVEYDQIIVDQYSAFPEPEVTIENGADYNGKTLDEAQYTIERKYEYAASASSTFDEIGTFTTSNAGVYRITLQISINDPDENAPVKEKSYTYTIYVASKSAEISFLDGATLTVNKNGYEISGDLSSPTGYAYILKSDEKLEGSDANGALEADDITKNSNVDVEKFRTTSLSLDFEENNDSGYYVYCVLSSLDGSQMSEVYELDANVVEIKTTADFNTMLASNNSSTIYLLENDLDFSAVSDDSGDTNSPYQHSTTPFKGLLNGLGHTIKNISTQERGVFEKLAGGTIENIKFENIDIEYSTTSSGEKYACGLIAVMENGYIYNVECQNLNVVSSSQRVGGLIGNITASSGTEATAYIELVSIVNTYTTTDESGNEIFDENNAVRISGVERVGGIVGFIQGGSTESRNKVYISECYVNAYITASSGIAAGIVGRSDDRNKEDYLEITGCHIYSRVESTANSKAYIGGVIGQFTGTGATRISDCTSYGELWYGGESLAASIKNGSWIVGNFAANGDIEVKNCYAKYEEYNEEYGVSASLATWNTASWDRYNPHDMKSGHWEYVYDQYGDPAAPYLVLVFQTDPAWETNSEG